MGGSDLFGIAVFWVSGMEEVMVQGLLAEGSGDNLRFDVVGDGKDGYGSCEGVQDDSSPNRRGDNGDESELGSKPVLVSM
jgi:hypothetical protein